MISTLALGEFFHKIATELEGDIPQSRAWHEDLLDDMALDMQQQAWPAVLPENSRQRLSNICAFAMGFAAPWF